MGQHTVLEIAAPQCAAQDFEGEVIALNLASGTYCSLRELGAVLWRDLAAGHPVEVLAALAAGSLGGPQPVLDFAANAVAQGLMRPAAVAATPAAGPQLAGALADGKTNLVFEVHEDMKTLILLDPVHEVDETRGWPNLPTSA
ncbi:MAG TPA: hypothetical protein VFS85_13555 [Dongiaceae bacterium]|nr:hypothetical protein [Dongiaceae bacterium]